MDKIYHLTSVIEKEGDLYVALCPELDVASQGDTVERAKANLKEALELFFEGASQSEIERRLRSGVVVERFDVRVGKEITVEPGVRLGQTAGAVGT